MSTEVTAIAPMSGSNRDAFHAQLAAIVEVLANAAVAEICKLVDDGFAVMRLELSQNQREIDGLRRRLLLTKIQSSRRSPLERLGALRRSGHVTRCAVKSRGNAELDKHNAKAQPTRQGRGSEPTRQGRGSEPTRQGRGSEAHGVVGMESCGRGVIQGCETTSVVSADFPASSNPESRSVRAQPDSQKNLHEQSRNAGPVFQSHPPPYSSQPSSENTNWESYHPNSDGAFTCHGNTLFTDSPQWSVANPIPGSHAGEPSPGRQGATRIKSDGSGASDGGVAISSDLGNVGSSLARNVDWKPDVVVVGSVPIKVEEDMSSEWSMMDGDARSGGMSAESRLQRESRNGDEGPAMVAGGERREGGVDAANSDGYSPLQPRNTETESTLDNIQMLSSFSTTLKGFRQVLHAQSNRGGKPAGHPFWCELCGKTFVNLPSLRRHQRVHTGEKPFSCHHCSKRFSHRHQMKNHERIHTGEKPFRCPICGRCFAQSNHMKRHLGIHATGERAVS